MAPPPIIKQIMLSPLLGTFATLILFGATCVQTYQYYSKYTNDALRIKALVAFLFVLESVHTGLCAHYIGYYLIQNYGDVAAFERIKWSVWASAMVGFVVAWSVNQFFVCRIYLLSRRNLWLAIIIGILATVRPAFAIAASALAIPHNEWTTFMANAKWIMVTGLSLGVVVDCLIAFCVSFHLLQGRSTFVEPTRNIINTLLVYTINSGALLTVFALLELVGLLALPQTLTFLGLTQIQIQLYANFFLATLNARQVARVEPATLVNLNPQPMAARAPFDRYTERRPKGSLLETNVHVQTETYVAVDRDRMESSTSLDKISRV